MPIDMSAATVKAPPKKRATTAVKATANTPQDTRTPNERRHDGLMGLASLGQGICMMTGQHADAMAIGKFFPPVSQEIANIADEYESVAAPIDFMIKIGPFGALITALLPLGLQIMANHGVIDASAAASHGVMPPDVLKAQMRAEMMRHAANTLELQNKAMAEANAAQQDYEKLMAERNRETAV